jgi:vancomycin permeability regulator SanA
MRALFRLAGVLGCVILAALLAIDVAVRLELSGHLFADAASAPSAPLTIVLGAEVYPDGRPSPALQARLDVAIDLVQSGKTNILVMSGGNGMFEVESMRAYLVAHDVPEEVVLPDPGGERTRASCEHARDSFTSLPVLIVSQADHAARATYICRRLGVDANGVAAAEFTGDRHLVYLVRERFALILAFFESMQEK